MIDEILVRKSLSSHKKDLCGAILSVICTDIFPSPGFNNCKPAQESVFIVVHADSVILTWYESRETSSLLSKFEGYILSYRNIDNRVRTSFSRGNAALAQQELDSNTNSPILIYEIPPNGDSKMMCILFQYSSGCHAIN